MNKAIFILGLFIFAIIGTTQAQTPVVKKRQVNQQKRIVQGVRTGELTKAEVIALEKQQRNINRTKKLAKSDGVVTKKEKAIIHHKQNRASANVYRKKHNGASR